MSGPTASIQYSWDGPGALGAGQDGYALVWNQATGKFAAALPAPASHTHPLSALTQSGATTGQAAVWDGAAWAPGSAGVTDHGGLTGLGDDDHAGYALLAPLTSGRNLMQTAVDTTLLQLKQAAGQANNATNLLEVRTNAGIVVSGWGQAGYPWSGVYYFANPYNDVARLAYGSSTLTVTACRFVVGSGLGAATVPLTVQLAAAQSGNAINVTSSGGAAGDIFKVSSAGTTTLAANAEFRADRYYSRTGAQMLTTDTGTLKCWAVLEMVSQIRGAAGSASAPSYSWPDSNNGMYYIGTDSWGLSANSTLRIQLDATGIGFFAATPVARQAFIADPTGGSTVDAEARTAITALITAMENYGLLATS